MADAFHPEHAERLEDPARPAPWDRRGMVVGSVQSGKTAHYTGLSACAKINSDLIGSIWCNSTEVESSGALD